MINNPGLFLKSFSAPRLMAKKNLGEKERPNADESFLKGMIEKQFSLAGLPPAEKLEVKTDLGDELEVIDKKGNCFYIGNDFFAKM